MIIKNIAKEIQETLKAKERALQRQEQDPNNPIDGTLTFTDMAARTVFVRMASNATDYTHVQLLQNGAMSVSGKGFYNSEAYRDSGGGLIMPISGIKDISVEYKGGYKAIRRATVNWTAGSIQELDRLTAHFLSIGRTVMLDWGWVYPEREGGYGAERNKLIQQNSFWNGFNTGEHPIDQRIFEEGAVNILKNKGDYDAIGGLVSNFDYTLNEDGTFDFAKYRYFSFPLPFVVNFANGDGMLTLEIAIATHETTLRGEQLIEKLNTFTPKMRSAINLVLAEQVYADVNTVAKRKALKSKLLAAIKPVIDGIKPESPSGITDLHFIKFVISGVR